MYEPHTSFETPSDNVTLWRYMDVARFLALLQNRAIYFARVRELGDPWEAAWPTGLKQRVVEQIGDPGVVHEYYQMGIANAVVNCWHENERESVAMWRLYTSGAEGAAIKTTVGQLKRSLAHEVRAVTIGRVQYIDHGVDDDGTAPAFNVLGPLFCKRLSFQHEREVRAIIANPDEPELQDAVAKLQPVPGQTFTVHSTLGERGLAVPVDLSLLIRGIVVSPQFPSWSIGALQRVVEGHGLSITVESSDLLRQPKQ